MHTWRCEAQRTIPGEATTIEKSVLETGRWLVILAEQAGGGLGFQVGSGWNSQESILFSPGAEISTAKTKSECNVEANTEANADLM